MSSRLTLAGLPDSGHPAWLLRVGSDRSGLSAFGLDRVVGARPPRAARPIAFAFDRVFSADTSMPAQMTASRRDASIMLLTIPQQNGAPLQLTIEYGQTIFVLGANGTGKSSLLQAFYGAHRQNARRILAHRQTWFPSDSPGLTSEQKRQTETNIQNADVAAHARWRDDFSALRAGIAIYDLLDAQNVRARAITDAVDAGNIERARELSTQAAPLTQINELLRLSNLPIQIGVVKNDQLLASKSGGREYSITQLSDGERNALLIAASVLTAPPATLFLIDEPERHLHRSIISPLLTQLFSKRPDCAFVVSTHDIMLPLDNREARTLLIRGCSYTGEHISSYDIDVIPGSGVIDDTLKSDILGARRRVLFVEGTESSLDKPLYALIFPNVSVISKGGCEQVEITVFGIRSEPELHWVRAFGVIDNDGRTPSEIARLQAKGVYPLRVHAIESVYYDPEIQLRISRRHSTVTGVDPEARVLEARAAALQAIAPHVSRLASRVIEKGILETINAQRPTQETIAAGAAVNIQIDVRTAQAAEESALRALINSADLPRIIARYPVRETAALTEIARRLGFQNREQYENSVRKLLLDDASSVDYVRSSFGALANDIGSP